ncbi:hypothetical protein SKAU_G00198530 [Synaphobranchus kaupii]|uniref:Uncharacterized protein n=1 Tax=Synaphobranchus kaupii TaxID=118154 RepID=A0A9Q1FF33_SYNKA|nr:hypothetical protein SKAU_G00198530 [Synaphobranchus kaupii]
MAVAPDSVAVADGNGGYHVVDLGLSPLSVMVVCRWCDTLWRGRVTTLAASAGVYLRVPLGIRIKGRRFHLVRPPDPPFESLAFGQWFFH